MVYKYPNLEREVIATMLGIDSVKQTRVYQDALIEGRQEGRQEGQCQIILRLLTRKVGNLPGALVGKIERLSNRQLEVLSDRILDLSTLEELTESVSTIRSAESSDNDSRTVQ